MLLLTHTQVLLRALGVNQGGMREGCLTAGVPLPLTYSDPKGTEPLLYGALLEGGDWCRGTTRLTWHRGFWLWLLTVGPKHMPHAPDGWEGVWDGGTAPSLLSSSLAQREWNPMTSSVWGRVALLSPRLHRGCAKKGPN